MAAGTAATMLRRLGVGLQHHALQRSSAAHAQHAAPGLFVAAGARAMSSKSSELAMIKELRENTGAPLMDVKKALSATEFDMEAAYAELRKRGLAAATKKAGRIAADGLVGVKVSDCGRYAAVVEINAETDFVSRNDQFQQLVTAAAAAVVKMPLSSCMPLAPGSAAEVPLAALVSVSVGAGTLSEAVTATAAVVGENIRVRRAYIMAASGAGEALGHYMHGAVGPGLGRQAALVKVCNPGGATAEEAADGVELAAVVVANKVAMHVVAVMPRFLSSDHVPTEVVAAEMDFLKAQTENSGKPANIVEKIVSGRMAKFHEEFCLLNQKFVMDDSNTVSKWVKREPCSRLEVVEFVRVKVGEGIDVEDKDFAAEVAAAVAETSA